MDHGKAKAKVSWSWRRWLQARPRRAAALSEVPSCLLGGAGPGDPLSGGPDERVR